eukprot:SAG31_NODE_2416_length_5732_cov_1.503462_8_plen_39_part_00
MELLALTLIRGTCIRPTSRLPGTHRDLPRYGLLNLVPS